MSMSKKSYPIRWYDWRRGRISLSWLVWRQRPYGWSGTEQSFLEFEDNDYSSLWVHVILGVWWRRCRTQESHC